MSCATLAAMALAACEGFDAPRFAAADKAPRVTPSRNQSPRVKGNRRNELCSCGCGLKRKRCPNGVKA
jgi:hypothetical protein